MIDRASPLLLLTVAGLVSQPLFRPADRAAVTSSRPARTGWNAEETAPVATGRIVGVVVDEQQAPVARASVQAFSVRNGVAQARLGQTPPPPSPPGGGSTATDAAGRFQLSGLELGEYLIAAEPLSFLPSRGFTERRLYATTFYPSTRDHDVAVRVAAVADTPAPIQIQLVPVRGARISGSVVSPTGRSTAGLDVRLFRRFGGFGSGASVASVAADGTFETPLLSPGWYRLTIASQPSSTDENGDFVDKLIEVRDRDVDGLSLGLGPGASISGRIVAENAADVPSPAGMRVNASPTRDQYSPSAAIIAPVAGNWSFRMTGMSGRYQFTVTADRPPFVVATRVTVDGVDARADAGAELIDGSHEVVVFVAPRESPKPAVDPMLSLAALVGQFKSEKMFFQQFAIAKAIVERQDASVLPSLVDWLTHEDRHVRGNTAFIFGRLGDPRGFQVITGILTDRSERPRGFITGGNWTLQAQIRSDRYYAAHLLGDLRDPRAIPILVPLLKDPDVNSIVPWALGEIGDKRAIAPLLDALDDESPSMRVLAISALETLDARDALPRLVPLLNDHRKSNFGAQVSVADAARAAIARLQ